MKKGSSFLVARWDAAPFLNCLIKPIRSLRKSYERTDNKYAVFVSMSKTLIISSGGKRGERGKGEIINLLKQHWIVPLVSSACITLMIKK